MDKKQVNDVVRQNVALLSKLSEQEVGMMPATEAPLPSVDQVKQIIPTISISVSPTRRSAHIISVCTWRSW